MTADVVTGCTGPDPGPRVRLTRLAWRAELLVDVEERTEELVCRGDARAAADQLTELADQHAEDDLDDPVAMAALEASFATAARLAGFLESWGAPGEGPACMPGHPIPRKPPSAAPRSADVPPCTVLP